MSDLYSSAVSEIRRGSTHLLLAMLVTASVYVVDQVYAVHLGRVFLDAHVLVTLLPLVTLTLGLALGQVSLVVLGKKAELAGSALTLMLVGATIMLVALWLSVPPFCGFFGLRLPTQILYAQIAAVCAVIYFVNIWFSFYLLHKGRTGVVFWSNLLGFFANWLGNHLAVRWLPSESAFVGLVTASAVALSLALLYKVALIYRTETLRPANPTPFFHAIRRLFVSEVLLSVSFSLFPLAVSAVLKLLGRDDQISMFNVAERVLYLLILPCYTYVSSTVSTLAKDARLDRDEVWRRNLPFFLGLSVAFPTVVHLVLNVGAESLWGFSTADERLGFLLLTGAFWGNVFVVRNTAWLKVRERTEYCAAVESFSLFAFVAALVVVALVSPLRPAAFAVAVTLLVGCRGILMSDAVVQRLTAPRVPMPVPEV